jgi:hypothetical protein
MIENNQYYTFTCMTNVKNSSLRIHFSDLRPGRHQGRIVVGSPQKVNPPCIILDPYSEDIDSHGVLGLYSFTPSSVVPVDLFMSRTRLLVFHFLAFSTNFSLCKRLIKSFTSYSIYNQLNNNYILFLSLYLKSFIDRRR